MENQQTAAVLSTKDWVLTLLISFIPLVGIIMLFVWAFGSTENPNKSNWAKAILIWYAIGFVFFIFLWVTVIGALVASRGSY
ncbi:hypothetical protein [Ohtaekwangia sp.]|jgi:cell division protein FtsX|uniref:hypothetical protein n=1 Tax=Ohtaekwangia sp. TaxID=2066019 RepID=UPI002F9379C0